MRKGKKLLSALSVTALGIFMTGCAHRTYAHQDPYEPYNRAIFAFNTDIDRLFIRPAAKVYDVVLPPPLKKGITNVYSNIRVGTTIPNDILQGKIKWTLVDSMRLIINTSIGIGGLFDMASRMGLPKHFEDFGMTLAYWSGNKAQPYFMLPLLGPNTTQSGFGLIFDYIMSPWPYLPGNWTYGAWALNIVQIRAGLLPADELINGAFDPYIFVRDAYLQIREKMNADNMQPYLSKAQREAAHIPQATAPDVGSVNILGAKKWNNDTDQSPIEAPPADFKFDEFKSVLPEDQPSKPKQVKSRKHKH